MNQASAACAQTQTTILERIRQRIEGNRQTVADIRSTVDAMANRAVGNSGPTDKMGGISGGGAPRPVPNGQIAMIDVELDLLADEINSLMTATSRFSQLA